VLKTNARRCPPEIGSASPVFSLSPEAAEELNRMSGLCGLTVPQLVRTGLGLLRIAVDGTLNERKLFLATATGNPLLEIVLPYAPRAGEDRDQREQSERRTSPHVFKRLGGEQASH